MSTAESCTGGGIGYELTSIAGASRWFMAGFIVYSNQAKQEILEVDAELISTHGAVSEPVVAAMAQGAARRAHSDYAVAVSGVAGPDGGSDAKPVGTVCFGWHGPSFSEQSTCLFVGDRQAVRQQAVVAGLEGLLRLIKKYTV